MPDFFLLCLSEPLLLVEAFAELFSPVSLSFLFTLHRQVKHVEGVVDQVILDLLV